MAIAWQVFERKCASWQHRYRQSVVSLGAREPVLPVGNWLHITRCLYLTLDEAYQLANDGTLPQVQICRR